MYVAWFIHKTKMPVINMSLIILSNRRGYYYELLQREGDSNTI